MTDPKFLAAFSGWLRAMGDDALALAGVLDAPDAPLAHRRAAAEALQGLARLVPLIPEGIEALGYLEGAFGFRVIAERALADDPELGAGPADGRVPRLAADSALIAEFLGDDMARLRERWLAPEASTHDGRAASEVLDDGALRVDVQREAREWVQRYQAPALGDGPEELVKIEAFFRTRLARAD